jgi:hypothetical protein
MGVSNALNDVNFLFAGFGLSLTVRLPFVGMDSNCGIGSSYGVYNSGDVASKLETED